MDPTATNTSITGNSSLDALLNATNSLVGDVLTYQSGQAAISATQQPTIVQQPAPASVGMLGLSSGTLLLIAAGLGIFLLVKKG
jgi:hypothetical protein